MALSKLFDLTDDLARINFDNKKSWETSSLIDIKNGLYLMLFVNSSDHEVRDKNINKKTGAIGKTIVQSNSMSIKYGKFEAGFIPRMQGYSQHLHRLPDLNLKIFPQIVQKCYCLDLTPMIRLAPRFNPAAIYESLWNRCLHLYFKDQGILLEDQNMRSEYRFLKSSCSTKMHDFVEKTFLESIGRSIDDSFLIFSEKLFKSS